MLLLPWGTGIFKPLWCSGPHCGDRHELALPKQFQAPDCKLFVKQKHVATGSPASVKGPPKHKIYWLLVHLEHRQFMLMSACKRQCKCSLLSFLSVTLHWSGLFALGDLHHQNPLSPQILFGPLSPAQHQQKFPTAVSREREVLIWCVWINLHWKAAGSR